jgi:hypothetical protein
MHERGGDTVGRSVQGGVQRLTDELRGGGLDFDAVQRRG